jgi:hypothetical protein
MADCQKVTADRLLTLLNNLIAYLLKSNHVCAGFLFLTVLTVVAK